MNGEKNFLIKVQGFFKSCSFYSGNKDYIASKTNLDKIYDEKLEELKIRNKCHWYEKEGKSTKFFLTIQTT